MEEQTVSPIPNAKPASDKFFKISLIILGLLVVIGLFGNIYLLLKKQTSPIAQAIPTPVPIQVAATPTIDPTAGWKTYANTTYNYSVRYPLSWFLQKMSTQGVGGVDILSSYKIPDMQVKDPNFWIGKLKVDMGKIIEPKKTNQSLEQWLTEYEKGPGGLMYSKISQEITTLADKKAIKVTSSSNEDSKQTAIIYYIENNSDIYFINAGGDFTEENKNIFNLILTTFKFLPSNSSDQTANWKTYKNETYNFNFKYPKDAVISPDLTATKDTLVLSVFLSKSEEFTIQSQKNPPAQYPYLIDINTQQERTIGGKQWLISNFSERSQDFGYPGNPPFQVFQYKSPDVTYAIVVGSQIRKETFDQILSTFKFN